MKLMKFSSKMLHDYIDGKNLDGYNIDTLENDIDFMTEVILISGDKNMYELCSKKLKTNYNFVSFLVNLFAYDKDFINKIITNYIKNEKDNVKRNEMYILLNNLSYDYDDLKEYRIVLQAFYTTKMVETYAIISKLEGTVKKEFGNGFYLILDEYSKSNIICDFFAVKMMDDIFSQIKLEDFIHQKFRKAEDLERFGINSLLLSIIRKKDKYLALHLENNLSLMNIYKQKVSSFIKRWNYYNDLLVEDALRQFDILCDKISREFAYLPEEILIYIVNKLKLNYLFETNSDYVMRKEFLNELGIVERIKNLQYLSNDERIFLLEAETIIGNIFFSNENSVTNSENKKLIKVNFKGSI